MPMPAGALVEDGPRPVGYGLALMIEDYRGHRVVHHGGNIDGFSSQVAVVPDAGVGVAVLTNLHATPLRDALPYLVFDELLGLGARRHGEVHHARWAAARNGAAQAKSARSERAKPLPAVRPLEDYVGTYRHPGYGDVQITASDGRLRGTYGLLEGPVNHRHLEVFDLVVNVNGDEVPFPVLFSHDVEANVDALALPLEPGLSPLRFVRRPDTSHLTDELLDRLAGTYALEPLEVVVSRRGEQQLLISVTGSAAEELMPVHDTTFSFEGAEIEFTDDGRLVTPFGEFLRKA
jgi:hypothetical protein